MLYGPGFESWLSQYCRDGEIKGGGKVWLSQMTWQNHHLIILLLLCPVSNICVCMSCTICHNMCASLQFWIWHNVTMSKSQTSMWIIADHQLGSNWLWFLYPVPSLLSAAWHSFCQDFHLYGLASTYSSRKNLLLCYCWDLLVGVMQSSLVIFPSKG